MAFGSWRSASTAFSNHSWNWTIGSGSTSALSRPALVYSFRRLEASTVYLPAPGAGRTFERADYVGGDPTPVEVPFLRLGPRRSRVIPDGLLSLTCFYSPAAHEDLLVFDLLRLYGQEKYT